MTTTVTADTITNAQIERVRRALIGVPRKNSYHRSIIKDCDAALGNPNNTACRESAAYAWNKMNRPPKMDADTLTDDDVREIFNAQVEGTAGDALRRQWCQIALGECCIRRDDREVSSVQAVFRYPTCEERREAQEHLAEVWNITNGLHL